MEMLWTAIKAQTNYTILVSETDGLNLNYTICQLVMFKSDYQTAIVILFALQ